MAKQQKMSAPVLMVKKSRIISPPPVVDKTESVNPSVPEVAALPTLSDPELPATTPNASPAPAAEKKRKGSPHPSHWNREFTTLCVEKAKAIFPHLLAEGGGFLPLKVGISRDIPVWLAEHPEASLTLDEWNCAISFITSRNVYLQNTSVAGATRYDLDGKSAGQVSEDEAKHAQYRLVTLKHRWKKKQAERTVPPDDGKTQAAKRT